MDMEALVSIIIPVYNTEAYLRKCIESVLSQTYSNFEVFLIDDGSTDSSAQMCDEFAASSKKVFSFHKKNAGQGVARNFALDRAHGDYIAFIDSDDYVRSDFLEVMVRACEESNADLAVCGYTAYSMLRAKNFVPTKRILNTIKLIEAYIQTPDIGGEPWNKLYRSELFNDLRFPELRANEDAYLMADILTKCKKAVVVDKPLYIQFLRNGSTERSAFSEKKLCLLEADRHLQQRIHEDFEALYPLVEYRYAETVVILMKSLFSNIDPDGQMYIRLQELLREEVQILPKNNKTKEYTHIINHPSVYKFLFWCRGRKVIIKKRMKDIILWLRRAKKG